MDALKRKRASAKAAVTRFENYLGDDAGALDVIEVKARLERFESVYDEYDATQLEIEALCETEADINAQATERTAFENSFYRAKARAQKVINDATPASTIPFENRGLTPPRSVDLNGVVTPPTAAVGVNLPRINLPNFDGAYEGWLKFRDTFVSLIHDNTSLNNIQKFHYLNSSLTGNAARAIESLGVSEANYTLAWDSLKGRYEDKGSLVHHHVSKLFELPKLSRDSYGELRQLIDDTNNNLLALNGLGEDTKNWDTMIIYLLSSKLNLAIKREWERSLSQASDKPTLKIMMQFLEQHCRFLHKLEPGKNDAPDGRRNDKTGLKKHGAGGEHAKSYAVTTKGCALCKDTSHRIYACREFKELSLPARTQKVIELKLCFNCLSSEHLNKDCKFGPCRRCGKMHNSLLHPANTLNRSGAPPPPVAANIQASEVNNRQIEPKESLVQKAMTVRETQHKSTLVFLPTANIYLYDIKGNRHECRALLDSGSQPNIMTNDLCTRLGLKRRRTAVALSGIEQGNQAVSFLTTARIHSRVTEFSRELTFLLLNKISDEIPSIVPSKERLIIPNGVELADPQFDRPQSVDLLIGAGLFCELLCVGQIKLKVGQPILQKTLLGWIVAGEMIAYTSESRPRLTCNIVRDDQLHEQLKMFWEVENFSQGREGAVDGQDNFCEQHFISTTVRNSDGRFVVSIPFKDNVRELGDSKNIALKRLVSLEKKFRNNPHLKLEYVKFMREYEALGHMTEVTDPGDHDHELNFYLPHHAVIKADSSTTKLRVVFDGSAKTTSGLSLNDVQHLGPIEQDDLFSILLRFRLHKYVISADIAKMYRQVLVKPEERKFQRILWREDESKPVRTLQLNTVTYGTRAGGPLATRSLKQVGKDCRKQQPELSEVIDHDFYIDDLASGAKTIEAAMKLKAGLQKLLSAYGFELRKWASNEPKIVAQGNDAPVQSVSMNGDKDPKTLGLLWNPNDDTLKYCVTRVSAPKITKRVIASIIFQIFDPLGLLGPAIVRAKILLQKLWSLELDWDESLPQDVHTAWIEIYDELFAINHLTISRYVFAEDYSDFEFHGMCDASELAYGACIYVCSRGENDDGTSQLFCAKSRVAPLKKISIPRLELCSALLLAELAHKISTACRIRKDQWHFWSDSMVALAWISSPSDRWKTFVANRVTAIQELTCKSWNHIDTKRNPADLISRGVSARELAGNDLWWHGPAWLGRSKQHWPASKQLSSAAPEQRKSLQAFVLREIREPVSSNECFEREFLGRYSSYERLIRITAYIFKFINKCKTAVMIKGSAGETAGKGLENYGELTKAAPLLCRELKFATLRILKLSQLNSFSREIESLSKGTELPRASKLLQLNPFVDESGLLRVGGRLVNAPIPYDSKHPIILDPESRLSTLIINYEHNRLMHAGCQAIMSSLRTRFWILASKNLVKKVLRGCVACFRARPEPTEEVMGNLPAARVTPVSRPFLHTGVDFAGPYLLKEKVRTPISIKAYICIFVCFATKAVHIELARDLSTESFLNCLKRFISRRGRCLEIYSDNGTNFVGTKNELREVAEFLASDGFRCKVARLAANENIEWHFIPPRASHFGGLWESAVKSAKYHLKRVIGETRLMYEELYTVLTQVEACLNSRPLSPLSNDPNDLTPLTPGHFLIGDLLTALPQVDLCEVNTHRLNRFQHLQQIVQHFWKRWQRDYLPQLQGRTKWRMSNSKLIKPGTMVLVKDENLPPLRWPLGRILEVYPGADGKIRVVLIKTAQGPIKRPITKVCILPVEESTEGLIDQQQAAATTEDD